MSDKDEKPSAKSAHIWFSREHTSKSNPEQHYDVYRKVSNKPDTEKIAHVPAPTTKIPINKNK